MYFLIASLTLLIPLTGVGYLAAVVLFRIFLRPLRNRVWSSVFTADPDSDCTWMQTPRVTQLVATHIFWDLYSVSNLLVLPFEYFRFPVLLMSNKRITQINFAFYFYRYHFALLYLKLCVHCIVNI